MKKLITLAVATILGFSANAASKKIVIPANMQPVTELESGKNYLIFDASKIAKATAGDQDRYCFRYANNNSNIIFGERVLPSTTGHEFQYNDFAWTVAGDATNGFSFKNVGTGKYIPTSNNGTANGASNNDVMCVTSTEIKHKLLESVDNGKAFLVGPSTDNVWDGRQQSWNNITPYAMCGWSKTSQNNENDNHWYRFYEITDAMVFETVDVTYTLTCAELNVNITGTYEVIWDGNNTTLPTIPGLAQYTLSNASYSNADGNYTITGNIVFPFPVSTATQENVTGIQSAIGQGTKWYANANGIMKGDQASSTSITHLNYQQYQWYIYPSYSSGEFTFKIKNQNGKYIPASVSTNASTGTALTDDESAAGNYYYRVCTNSCYGFGSTLTGSNFLSINSGGTDQNVFMWNGWSASASHVGSNLTFPAITYQTEEEAIASNNTAVRTAVLATINGCGLNISANEPEGKQYFTEYVSSPQVNAKIEEVLASYMPDVRAALTGKQLYFRAQNNGNQSVNGCLTVTKAEDGTYQAGHYTDISIGSFWSASFNETTGNITLTNLYYDGMKLCEGNSSQHNWVSSTATEFPFNFSAAHNGTFVFNQPTNANKGIDCHGQNTFGYWDSNAATNNGSHWFAHVVDSEMDAFSTALLATAPANTEAVHVNTTNGIDDALAAAIAALTADKSSIANYKTLETAIANADVVTFNPDYFYHIKSVERTNFKYAYTNEETGAILGGLADPSSNPFSFLKFEPITIEGDESGVQKYNIACNGGHYAALSNTMDTKLFEATSDENIGRYYIEHNAQGKHYIKDYDVTGTHSANGVLINALHANSSNQMQNMTYAYYADWYIEVAQKVTVNLNMSDGNYNYGVGYFPFPVAVDPDDSSELMLLYIGFDKDTQKPVLSYNVPSIVPANVAFLVRNSSNAKANLAIAYAAPAMIDDEDAPTYLLSGSLRSTTAQAGDYTVGITDNGFGFVKQTAAPTVASNSIYLPAEALQSSAKHLAEDVLLLNAPEHTTGIAIVTAEHTQNGIYDLQGRKLSAPVKGINIIGGRKVLVK